MNYWRWGVGAMMIGGIVLLIESGGLSGALTRIILILGEMASTLFVLGGLAAANAMRIWWRGKQAARWPATGGVIIRSNVESKKLRDGNTMYRTMGRSTHYRADVAYGYELDGRHYENKRIRSGAPPGWSRDRIRAEELVAPYSAGQAVEVRYNPRRPADSVLEPGVDGFWRGIVLFSLVCLVLALLGSFYS